MLAHDVWHRPASRLHIRSDPTHASSLPHNVQLELEYVRNGGIKLLVRSLSYLIYAVTSWHTSRAKKFLLPSRRSKVILKIDRGRWYQGYAP